MIAFIFKRLLSLIPILLGVTFISFLIISLTPGDFVSTMAMDPTVSRERLAGLRHDFGLDRPWYVQYGLWLYRISPIEFPFGLKIPDLGYSFANRAPVTALMSSRFVNTMILTVSAEIFIWIIAIPLGVIAAVKRNTVIDRTASFAVFFGISMPEILLALLALLLAARSALFPIGGMHSLHYEQLSYWQQLGDLLHHLALPVLVLGITGAAGLTRYMRSSLLETLNSDYIRTARAKGLSWRSTITVHAFRNAINPLITLLGISFANLVSSSFLVEIIMGWPGLGKLTYDAILTKDMYVIMASLMAATTFLILGNLFSDLLLALNDPRIRYEHK
jgi:peptide/nickel transport system permease protein